MCSCDNNIKETKVQNDVINDFFNEVSNELASILQEVNTVSLTAKNLGIILARLCRPAARVYSLCRGISMLDPRLEPLANEMSVLNKILDEVKKQISPRSFEDQIPAFDLCSRFLEISATATGLCFVNPLFCPLAGTVCLLARIVCAIIPPLRTASQTDPEA